VDTNPAAFGLDPDQGPRVVMVCGGSTGPLSLYCHPIITEFASLRGAALGVDNPASGFALVLRDMLARNGLHLTRDYTFIGAGGTSARLDALTSGAVPATVLYAPFDALAAGVGFRRLAISTDYYAAYASLSTAGRQPWLEAHAAVVVRYIAALRQALRWIYVPAHISDVQHILEREPAFELTSTLAAQACAAFVDPVTGFGVDAMLSEAGLQQVIDLRAAYSPVRPAGVPRDYLDLRWYHQASALLKG
jgi:ABC-type nitrate/sulfonate/bicarbonate transport system substrate-binding protein